MGSVRRDDVVQAEVEGDEADEMGSGACGAAYLV